MKALDAQKLQALALESRAGRRRTHDTSLKYLARAVFGALVPTLLILLAAYYLLSFRRHAQVSEGQPSSGAALPPGIRLPRSFRAALFGPQQSPPPPPLPPPPQPSNPKKPKPKPKPAPASAPLDLESDTSDPSHAYLAICVAIGPQKPNDVLEWIEYHRRKGVGRFYILENNIHGGGKEKPVADAALKPLVKSDLVHYEFHRGLQYHSNMDNAQQFTLDRCGRLWAHNHTWLGFIDVDEFIVTENRNASIPSVLRTVLAERGGPAQSALGAVSLHWRVFGSSGHWQRPKGGVLKNYRMCTLFGYPDNEIFKQLIYVRNAVADDLWTRHTHNFRYKDGASSYNLDGKETVGNRHKPPSYKRMWINHYAVQSREDFEAKEKRGAGDGGRRQDAFWDEVEKASKKDCGLLEMPPRPARDKPAKPPPVRGA